MAISTAFIPHAGRALTISPPIIAFDVAPGSSVSPVVRIYNELNVPFTVTTSVAMVSQRGEHGEVAIDDHISTTTSLGAWVKSIAPFELGARAWRDVVITISVPAEIAAGSYAGAVLFENYTQDTSASPIGVVAKTGPILVATVAGNAPRHVKVLDFGTTESGFLGLPLFDARPVFSVRLENTGKVVVTPSGSVRIGNIIGGASMHSINDADHYVLPGWRRIFMIDERGSDGFLGLGREWERFGFGRYTATLSLDAGDHAVDRSIVYWVIPWRLLVIAVGSLSLITLLFVGRRR